MTIYRFIDTNNIINITHNNENYYRSNIITNNLILTSYNLGNQYHLECIKSLFLCKESTPLFAEGKFDEQYCINKVNKWDEILMNKDPFVGLLVFERADKENDSIDEANINNLKFVGHCTLTHGREGYPGEVEFQIILLKEFWNKKYGTEMTKCVVNEYTVALSNEGYQCNGGIVNSVFATARPDNNYSIKILTGVGMKQFGEQKKIYNDPRDSYIKTIDRNLNFQIL